MDRTPSPPLPAVDQAGVPLSAMTASVPVGKANESLVAHGGRERASRSFHKRSIDATSPERTLDGSDRDALVGEGRWMEATGLAGRRMRLGETAIDQPASASSSASSSPRHARPMQWQQPHRASGECSGAGSPMMARLFLMQQQQQQQQAEADSKTPSAGSSDSIDQPSALDVWEQLRGDLAGKQLVVFLDYDGTLTPIVAQPSAAVISAPQRQRLAALASCCPVAIVTGRKLDTITNFLNRGGPLAGLDRLYFAGSHGFDIRCPSSDNNKQVAAEYLPHLAAFRDAAAAALADMPGALVEDNTFSISVHYRNVAPEDRPQLDAVVDAALAAAVPGRLRKTQGHMVHEIRANFAWHKGAAVHYLLQLMCADLAADAAREVVPIYIGDDVTDEDAFRTLRSYRGDGSHPHALSILVRDCSKVRPSAATHVLASPDEVGLLLERITQLAHQR